MLVHGHIYYQTYFHLICCFLKYKTIILINENSSSNRTYLYHLYRFVFFQCAFFFFKRIIIDPISFINIFPCHEIRVEIDDLSRLVMPINCAIYYDKLVQICDFCRFFRKNRDSYGF
jgi:hypothetical protein